MTSTTNPSTMLADALAQFSKAAYNAFTEIESRASIETRKANEETREIRSVCGKIQKDLHSASLEAQRWKQEAADAKAALAQAELKAAHQTELHNEAIAQLQREVSQLKDQSRNWQKHFLRVEQERCTQTSRIDELMKSYYSFTTTPKQKYANTIYPHIINSAPSSITTKGATISSPTKPPSYKSTALSTSESGSCSDASPQSDKIRQMNQSIPLKRRRDITLVDSSEMGPQPPIGVQHRNSSPSKRKNKGNDPNIAPSSSSQRQDPQNPASHTTLIRRVQAVVHIKREESDDGIDEDVLGAAKDDASDEDEISRAIQRRSSRRSNRNFIMDDEENVEQKYIAADDNPVRESRHLRHRNGIINYREEDEDEDDVDELMIGAEGNEILGAQLSKPPSPPPPKKKRKLAARR